jgi:hypothetical protein
MFLPDFYLIKFNDDGIKRVLSRDKIKIEDESVEVGTPCEAYWEDSNIKGWFEAIILSFEGMKHEMKPIFIKFQQLGLIKRSRDHVSFDNQIRHNRFSGGRCPPPPPPPQMKI